MISHDTWCKFIEPSNKYSSKFELNVCSVRRHCWSHLDVFSRGLLTDARLYAEICFNNLIHKFKPQYYKYVYLLLSYSSHVHLTLEYLRIETWENLNSAVENTAKMLLKINSEILHVWSTYVRAFDMFACFSDRQITCGENFQP